MRLANLLYTIPLRLRSVFRRKDVEQELEEELRYHLQQQTEANIAKGSTLAEARYEALRALHGVEQRKEECRDTRGVHLIENLARDLRYAARMLRKNPAFTTVAVLSLALGIGANTAIFSLIDTLLLRPLPVPHPEQLRIVALDTHHRGPQFYLTYPIFEALRSQNQVFVHIFAWANHKFQIRSGRDMVHIDGVLASGDYFSTLEVAPLLGRTFTTNDDHSMGGKDGPVAVISEQFWSRQFQRAPSAIGSGITLDRVRFTIVGVMPGAFFGAEVGSRPDVWIPLSLDSAIGGTAGTACLNSRTCWWLTYMGRIKAAIPERQVEEQLKVISSRLLQDAGPTRQRDLASWQFFASPGAQGWTGLRTRFSNPLAILMTLVGLVLMIACANMANLLLARASARQREIAVRLSIGASRVRIMQQFLTESVTLSLLGAAAGSLFAVWLTRLLVAFLESKGQFGPDATLQLDLHPDWRVVIFTLAVAIGSGVLFGLAPAIRATHTGSARALKEGAHQLRGGEKRVGIGRLILPVQAALSVLLVAAAGLFAGSLYHLLTLNFGFDPQDVTLIAINTDRLQQKDAAKLNMYRTLQERVNTMRGVRAASLMWFTPLSNSGWDEFLSIPDERDLPEQDRDTYINTVGTRYFEVMKIPLLAGRTFSDHDTAASEKVGIINRLAAQRFFPNHNPIGAHVVLEKNVIRIVGVVQDIKYLSLRDVDPPEMYLPYAQQTDGVPSLTVVVKTVSNAPAIYPEFRAALREIAPDVPIEFVKTMQEQVNESVGSERLMASLSIFFGTLALLLTSIGLYGTLAYAVTRRTGEIGIRMALGARGREVVWLVLRGTVGLVGVGTAVGIAAVVAASRLVRSLLYGVQPNDPGNLILAICALLLVAAVAAYMPARRASRLDPTVALREE